MEITLQLMGPLATLFQVAKQVVIPPSTEMMVPVRILQAHLHHLSPLPNALKSCSTLCAFGTVDTVLYKPFCPLNVSCSTKLTSLPSVCFWALELAHPKRSFFSHRMEMPPKEKRVPVYSLYKWKSRMLNHHVETAEKDSWCPVCAK